VKDKSLNDNSQNRQCSNHSETADPRIFQAEVVAPYRSKSHNNNRRADGPSAESSDELREFAANEADMLGQSSPYNEEVDLLRECHGIEEIDFVDVLEVRGSLGNRQLVDREVLNRSGSSQLNSTSIHTLDCERSDPQAIGEAEISQLVSNNSYLDEEEKVTFVNFLLKYAPYLTSRPGKCKIYEYEFKLIDNKPIVDQVKAYPI
jgi:hypothetical protein